MTNRAHNAKPASPASNPGIWNHRGPVEFSPLFAWPPNPKDAVTAIGKRWVTLSRNTLFLLFAVVVYSYFLPDINSMKTLSLEWILPAFLRNVFLLVLVAGGLHLYLFTFRGQASNLKFDPKEQMEGGRRYSFNHQVYDNIFWSLASGATLWTAYEVLYFWGVANGVIPTFGLNEHPLLFVLWLLLMPLVLSAHFYFIHRMLHWPPLYKHVHSLHHRNTHIGPWSGMSMHPVEHVFYLSSVLIHFIIPSHPIIVLVHLYTRTMAPAFSHAGFEKVLVGDKKLVEAADFHHQLHHRFFECNYGNVDTPWDRWFGSYHDGTDEATRQLRQRRKQQP